MLEDEKLRGTCHLALGNIRYHADMLVDKPTIKATYADDVTREIVKNGVLIQP
jgi:leucyl aminopeptidase (aminopeptidase T)